MLEANTVVQGRYRVISQIGRGGMGTVYLAKDENLGVTVAVKQNFFDDNRLIEAFKREARLLAGLRHSALPKVIDYFINEAGQFLVMEYIKGDNLETILDKRRQNIEPAGEPKPFEVGEVVHWGEQLLDTLDYLHTLPEPVIHRDIKPQNLKLAGRNQIVLLDFGLAKGKPQWMTRVTTTGSIHGYTPNYAPLEQIQGGGTDLRSDLYALGATLYHLITGVPPMDAVLRADTIIGGEPDPLQAANKVNPKVPGELAAMLMKAMEQHRNKRPSTAAEMLEALRAAKHYKVIDPHAPVKAEPPAPVEIVSDPKDAWPVTEIRQTESDEEAERRAREVAERKRQQKEEAAALQAQREQERERLAAEAGQRDEQLRIQLQKKTGLSRKTRLTIIVGVVLVTVAIWVIVAMQNKSAVSSPDSSSTEKRASARLKAGIYAMLGNVPDLSKVSEVSFSDDGRVLAFVDEESVIHLWQALGESTLGGDHPGSGKCVAVSHDGQLVASYGGNNTILLKNVGGAQTLKTLIGDTGGVFSLGFSPDGQSLFSASHDKAVKLWRVSDGGLIKTVKTPEKGYAIVAVSPDLRLVGFYNPNGSFKLWSLEQDDLIRMLDGDVPAVNCGAFSRDAEMLALGSKDGKVELWRVRDGRLMKALGQFDTEVVTVALSADSRILAAGFKDGAIRLWRVSDGKSMPPLTGHTQSVNSLSFSGDGRTLASGSDDKTARIWDVPEN
ncbi:MAG: protein kinase [Blastocatellia bacterium]